MNKLITAVAVAFLTACEPTWAVVPSDVSHVELTAPGNDHTFDFTFKTTLTSQIDVYLAGVLQNAGYAVTLNPDQTASPGGTVTFTVAPLDGTVVRIERNVSLLQSTTWTPYSAFKASALEAAFDLAAMRDQQLDRRISIIETTPGIVGPQGPQGVQGPAGSINAIGSNLDFVNTYRATNLAAPAAPYDAIRNVDLSNALAPVAATWSLGANWVDTVPSSHVYQIGHTVFATIYVRMANAAATWAEVANLPPPKGNVIPMIPCVVDFLAGGVQHLKPCFAYMSGTGVLTMAVGAVYDHASGEYKNSALPVPAADYGFLATFTYATD